MGASDLCVVFEEAWRGIRNNKGKGICQGSLQGHCICKLHLLFQEYKKRKDSIDSE